MFLKSVKGDVEPWAIGSNISYIKKGSSLLNPQVAAPHMLGFFLAIIQISFCVFYFLWSVLRFIVVPLLTLVVSVRMNC